MQKEEAVVDYQATETEAVDFISPSGDSIKVLVTNHILGSGSFGLVYHAYSAE